MSGIAIAGKENSYENSNHTTPHGSPTNKMWDSNDPMRNPPPLPVSPQMFKVKNPNLSPRSIVPGKLSFNQNDDTDIDYQLQKLLDMQISLKKIVQGIDDSVKTTQLDLDNLVSRSTNNNSHLKDLLQNFAGSSDKNITEEKLSNILELKFSHLAQTLIKLEELSQNISTQLEPFTKDKELSKTLEKIQSENEVISATLDKLKTASETNNLESVQQSLSNTQDSLNIMRTSAEKSLEITNLLSSNIEDKFHNLKSYINELNENHQKSTTAASSQSKNLETTVQEVNSQLASITTQIDNLKTEGQLSLKEDHLKEYHTNITKSITGSFDTKLNETQSKFDLLSKSISEQLVQNHSKVSSISEIIHTLNTGDKLNDIQRSIVEKFENNDTQLKEILSELSASKESNLQSQLTSKDLELQLKDKEIEELKKKLNEQSEKQKINESIMELSIKKVELETRYELLGQTYNNRYKEFQQLHTDHNELVSQMSQINLDKLASIIGSATLSKYSANETSPKKQPLGTRIMSTNSYLQNVNVGTPKSVKKYELDLVEDQENF